MGHSLTLLVLCTVTFTLADNSCMLSQKDTLKCKNIIPTDLLDGVTRVELVSSSIVFASSLFKGKGWNNITSLEITSNGIKEAVLFKASCFETLVRLTNLQLHLLKVLLDKDTFKGLHNVEVLDLTNSTNIQQSDLIGVLSASCLPKLRTLIIAGTGIYYGYFLNEDFWKQMEKLKISYLGISYVRADIVNMTAFLIHSKYVRTLIARGLYIGTFYEAGKTFNVLTKIRVLDISKSSMLGLVTCVVSQYSGYKDITINLERLRAFSAVQNLLIDGLCDGLKISLQNIRNISFKSDVSFNLKSLSLNNNGLVHVDVIFSGHFPTLTWLSGSGNMMEYLNPNVFRGICALKNLDLSMNKLETMNRENITQFQVLLTPLSNLRYINLARNGLLSIPNEFFYKQQQN